MELKIHPTPHIVAVSVRTGGAAVEARIWEGIDEHGVPVFCLVTRVGVSGSAPQAAHDRFAAELKTCIGDDPVLGAMFAAIAAERPESGS